MTPRTQHWQCTSKNIIHCRFKLKVFKTIKKPIERQVAEAALINHSIADIIMNRKEWVSPVTVRLQPFNWLCITDFASFETTLQTGLNIIYTPAPSVTLMFRNYSCNYYSSLCTTGHLTVLHIFSFRKALLGTLKRQRTVAKYICCLQTLVWKEKKHKQSRRNMRAMS